MLKRLVKTKTFWGALVALITAAESVAVGSASLTEGLQLAIPALMALFLRDGIAKTTKPTGPTL